jgi:amino acid adenylation domain-containing protein/non-ribosomal peptide synthase protein (TIGR01720 family)
MRNVEEVLPLSGTQQGILFHVLSEPGADLYIEQAAWTLEGDFESALFERAWQQAIARHSILRTCFFVEKLKTPVQAVRQQAAFQLVERDWRGLAAAEQQQSLLQGMDQERHDGFVLSRAPLLKVLAIRLDDRTWRIIWTWHHLILDGWSVSLLLADVFGTYSALRMGVNAEAPRAQPYRDYLAWLRASDVTAAETYWRDALKGFDPDTVAQAEGGQGYVKGSRELSAADTLRLRDYARTQRVTLNTVVQTAWALLLGRYLDRTDILFGVLASGRSAPLPGIESMLGLFLNTLPLRVDGSPEQTMSALLQRVQATHSSARVFEHISLAQIQKWTGLSGRRPLDSLVVFDNLPAVDPRAAEAAGVTVRDFVHSTAHTGYPVTLEVFPEDCLRMQLTCDRSRFAPTAAARMLGHLESLLMGIASGVERAADLDMLTPAEDHQVTTEWNDTEVSSAATPLLHRLIQEEAARSPDTTAVVCGRRRLTYRELDAHSNACAHLLARRGAGPETRVAICVDRSLDLVVWLVAILKTGAAYVPLDPSYPGERLRFMVDSCGAALVVAERRYVPLLPVEAARMVVIEDDSEPIQTMALAGGALSGDNAAYAIFTSGSTGTPKAAENTHAAIVNRLLWMQREFALTADDRVLQKTPISFDVSVWELFWPLIAGAQLVMAAPGGHRDNAYLRELIIEAGITTVHFVPSMLRAFLEEPDLEQCATLRRIVASGEALSQELQAQCLERLPAKLYNLYGPTEAAVDVTWWNCSSNGHRRTVPIGRPIDNVLIRILDATLRPVPVGVPGELCIGGRALARRYLARPDLTAERFVPDPYARHAGARLYRTGDKAAYLPDGAIEFLGRLDHQVKIRGFRVEVGEIEAVLRLHPDVADAVVLFRDDHVSPSLVAYYLAPSGRAVAQADVREFLATQLPEHMIPASFLRMDAWPLTPSGKLDRRALPAPGRSPALEHRTSPRTTTEKTLADIWSALLGIPEPGVFENFFELGGDSIHAMIASTRARQAGLNIGVRDIFDRGTIAALAASATATAGPTADQLSMRAEAPLGPIQQWFFEHWGDDPNHFNQAIVLELAPTPAAVLSRAVAMVIGRHDALSLRFRRGAQGWTQVANEPATNLQEIDLTAVPAHEQQSLFREAAARLQASLDITSGPLLRAVRFSFGRDQSDLLLVAVHHLAIDGVSWRIVLEDLSLALEQLKRGGMVAFPSPTAPFLEWAARLGELAQSADIRRQTSYWTARAQSGAVSIPVDFRRGPNSVASTRSVDFTLSQDETLALLQDLQRKHRVRIDEAVVSAVARVLARWTGASSVRIAVEGHGREPIVESLDISRTVGWFTALYPVLLQVPDVEHPLETLLKIHEQLRAVPKSGLGYGLLRYAGGTERQSDRAPEPEVLVNYLGQFELGVSPAFRYSNIDPGPVRAATAARSHLLEINCGIESRCLRCQWAYSDNVHAAETIERRSEEFRTELQRLAADCTRVAPLRSTPADFPLAQLNESELAAITARQPDIEDIYRLSPIQEQLLYHHLRLPTSDVYFEQCGFTIRGSLNLDAFREACQQCVDRHPILRTSFEWQGVRRPVQVVHRRARLPVEESDWRHLQPEECERRRRELFEIDRREGFDLGQAPLLRFQLVRTDDDQWVCLWTYHHLLLDAWSMLLGVGEILWSYQALARGTSPRVNAARPYRDYIAWLDEQDPADAEAFWTRRLNGIDAPTPLPGDAVRRDATRHRAEASAHRSLTASTTQLAMRFARARRITVNTIVQGAWALLLARWSGRSDVCFGATISCRPPMLAGSETMIGVFINTVPFRTAVDPTERVTEWLDRLHGELSELLPHAATPSAEVHAWSGAPSGAPMFESVLVFQNHPRESLPAEAYAGLEIAGLQRVDKSAWPLMLVVEPGPELRLELIYDHNRIDRTTIARLLEQLAHLIEEIQADPVRRVGDLSVLTPEERHLALVEWNDTETRLPDAVCYHHLFETQARRTPDGLAVAFRDDRLTYSALNRYANQIARCLRDLGSAPEKIVAVCLERSTHLVSGRLAVLKTGAAYLPLDPALPPERLQHMVDDARADILVTEARLRDRIPGSIASVLCLDTDFERILHQDGENLDVAMSPDNLAYVIYTSGSTGGPKGVATAHAGLVNLIAWHNRAYRITPRDRKSQLSGLGFDASVWEMWPYLAAGASVHIPDDETRADWPKLLDWMCGQEISVCFFPTPLAEAVIEQPWPERFVLRALLTGGDRLHQWPRQPLKFDFVNKYGPTEVTAVTTWAPFHAAGTSRSDPPAIGRPIANLQLYLLDKDLQPLPAGASGELYVGGIGVARGYVGRADLTAEKFVPSPFSSRPGARLYRTGDLARWSRHGELEFLGRLDSQIKIRGFRIEPGEIESRLNTDPAVQSAVVLARRDSTGGVRLTAYVVPANGGTVHADDLRGRLGRMLPDYMVPSQFVVMDAFPLTPNGKVNRRALPNPQVEADAMMAEDVEARTDGEQRLAQIWCQVLGLERVGLHDNFFALGGDSILAIRISAAAAQLGIELSPAAVFMFSTIAQLAGHVSGLDSTVHVEQGDTLGPDPGDAGLSKREFEVLARRLSNRT